MVIDRRTVGMFAAALGLPAIAGASQPAQRRQLVHHVFFWLKDPATADRLIAGLETLRAVPEIRELRIGRPAATEQRSVVDGSWHVSELMIFDSVDAQRRYQEHPIHKRFVETCGMLWERVTVYDSMDV